MNLRKAFFLIPTLISVAGSSTTGWAQQGPVSPEPDIFYFSQSSADAVGPVGAHVAGTRIMSPAFGSASVNDHTVTFISAMEPGAEGTVSGAPYAADAVTETVQTLSDGNRIVRRVSSQVARDRDGRTRRDQSLEALGPWTADSNGAPKVSFITDPVAKVQLILEHEARTVRQLPLKIAGVTNVMTSRITGGGKVANFEVALPALGDPAAISSMMVLGGPQPADGPYKPRTDSLGKQFIEGVEAEGTRTTTIIPAGSIGNERQIDIVSESWYAPSLQLVILRRNNDPRFGETTYRLENLSLADPLPSLFEVPRDYSVASENIGPPREIRKLAAPPK